MEIPARTSDEPRWLLIGKIDEKHFPAWMVDSLDREARRLSVTRGGLQKPPATASRRPRWASTTCARQTFLSVGKRRFPSLRSLRGLFPLAEFLTTIR